MTKHHSGSRSMALLFSFFLPTWIYHYSLFFFFPLARPCGMRKFPDQASNSCHSSNWSCYSDNARSLTCCITRELQTFFLAAATACKSPWGQGLNPCHSNDKAESLTTWPPRNSVPCLSNQRDEPNRASSGTQECPSLALCYPKICLYLSDFKLLLLRVTVLGCLFCH